VWGAAASQLAVIGSKRSENFGRFCLALFASLIYPVSWPVPGDRQALMEQPAIYRGVFY
jgi:hypothetical protein